MSVNTSRITEQTHQNALAYFREQCIQNRLEAIFTNESASDALRRTCARISRERLGGKLEQPDFADPISRDPEAWKAEAMSMLERLCFRMGQDDFEHSPFCRAHCAPQWVREPLYHVTMTAVEKAIDEQAAGATARYERSWDEAFLPEHNHLWEVILRHYRPEYMQQSWITDLLIYSVLKPHQPIDVTEVEKTDFIRNMELRKPGFYSYLHRFRRPLTVHEKDSMMRKNQWMFVPMRPHAFDKEHIDEIDRQLEVIPILMRHLSLRLMNFMLDRLELQGFQHFERQWRATYPQVEQPLDRNFLIEWVQDYILAKWGPQYVGDEVDEGFQFASYSPFYIFGELVKDDEWRVPEANADEWESFDPESPLGR